MLGVSDCPTDQDFIKNLLPTEYFGGGNGPSFRLDFFRAKTRKAARLRVGQSRLFFATNFLVWKDVFRFRRISCDTRSHRFVLDFLLPCKVDVGDRQFSS